MIYYAATTAIRHGDDCYFLPPHSHRYIPSFPMPSKNTSAANQRTDSRCVVPRPGVEPGWIAPLVFETSASTDSAIWASRLGNALQR